MRLGLSLISRTFYQSKSSMGQQERSAKLIYHFRDMEDEVGFYSRKKKNQSQSPTCFIQYGRYPLSQRAPSSRSCRFK